MYMRPEACGFGDEPCCLHDVHTDNTFSFNQVLS